MTHERWDDPEDEADFGPTDRDRELDALLGDDDADDSASSSKEESAETDDLDPTEEEEVAVETGVDALMRFSEDTASAKEASDALFQSQLAEAEAKSRWYEPPAPELSTMEVAAQKASAMDTNEWNAFKATLEAQDRAAYERAHPTPEEDPAAFDPNTLSGPAFDAFVRAAASGGVNARDIPAGETLDSWTAKVESALAGGVDR